MIGEAHTEHELQLKCYGLQGENLDYHEAAEGHFVMSF
jgi:hypothetical protein